MKSRIKNRTKLQYQLDSGAVAEMKNRIKNGIKLPYELQCAATNAKVDRLFNKLRSFKSSKWTLVDLDRALYFTTVEGFPVSIYWPQILDQNAYSQYSSELKLYEISPEDDEFILSDDEYGEKVNDLHDYLKKAIPLERRNLFKQKNTHLKRMLELL